MARYGVRALIFLDLDVSRAAVVVHHDHRPVAFVERLEEGVIVVTSVCFSSHCVEMHRVQIIRKLSVSRNRLDQLSEIHARTPLHV
jgi:hypothetical protein